MRMPSRIETAAATRRGLLDAAGELLDDGGPPAVTLREVGTRAGVSRTAPYRHFADKESLLTALAIESWNDVGDVLQTLPSRPDATPRRSLRDALLALVAIGRTRPHLYRLMFTMPAGDPTAGVAAAERVQDQFLEIVAGCVGPEHARQYGGLLLTSAHGMTDLELSGHLTWDKWHSTPENLVDLLISRLPATP
jgi:AcrR family transcriptional regulator